MAAKLARISPWGRCVRLGESADWPAASTDCRCHGDFATANGFGLDRYASEPELRCMAFSTSAAASRLIVPDP